MVTPPAPCSFWQPEKLPLPRPVQLDTTRHYTGHLAAGDKDLPLNAHRETLKIAGSLPGRTDEVNVQTWGKYYKRIDRIYPRYEKRYYSQTKR